MWLTLQTAVDLLLKPLSKADAQAIAAPSTSPMHPGERWLESLANCPWLVVRTGFYLKAGFVQHISGVLGEPWRRAYAHRHDCDSQLGHSQIR